MTVSPPSRPLLPVLVRMALGLLVVSGGALVAWRGVKVNPNPGLIITTTPLELPLDGPQPFDLADFASLRLEGDLVDVQAGPLPARSPDIVQGSVKHRARNAVKFDTQRHGKAVSATLKLHVQAIDRRGVVVNAPEPVQHSVSLNLSRSIALALAARTTSGDLNLNLAPLRLRALNLRSSSGDQDITLPGRVAGPFSLVSSSGYVKVSAPDGANPEALRVNTVSGDQALDLGGVSTPALGIGSSSGNVRVTLPYAFQRGSLTTNSGDVVVNALSGTRGNLDIRTQSGDITLRVPPELRLRLRFTDRDTLTLPKGTPPATAPDLDVFVDTTSGDFKLLTPDGQAIPVPAPDRTDATTPSGRGYSRPSARTDSSSVGGSASSNASDAAAPAAPPPPPAAVTAEPATPAASASETAPTTPAQENRP